MKHKGNVRNILIDTVKKQKWLSSGILIAVLGAIGASLIPPLLGFARQVPFSLFSFRIIDGNLVTIGLCQGSE